MAPNDEYDPVPGWFYEPPYRDWLAERLAKMMEHLAALIAAACVLVVADEWPDDPPVIEQIPAIMRRTRRTARAMIP